MRLPLALRLARRELRGGIGGFRIFLACLILGVAAIAGVQSIAAGVRAALAEDGRTILGADVSLRTLYNPVDPAAVAWLEGHAEALSQAREMRAMARRTDGSDVLLVELKAVDGLYPLYGAMELEGGGSLEDALAERAGVWGAVVEGPALTRLGLAIGDRVTLGEATLELRAVIAREPDRAADGFALGPRLMIAMAALPATELEQPGSLITFQYRLRLPSGTDAQAFVASLRSTFPQATWRIRDHTNASPSLEDTIDRLALFLTLVGLTALLVGGVGVGNAVRAYLDGRMATIATLKCLGAPSSLVFQIYLTQVMALALLGTAIGLVIGAAIPLALGGLLGEALPIQTRIGIHPGALLQAAAFGLLTALTFSLWPLARAQAVAAGALFRDLVSPARAQPRRRFVVATAASALVLALLAILGAEERLFALWFVLGAIGTILAFRAIAWGALALSRRVGGPANASLRLAIANLNRPGAPAGNVVLSLGLGLTVLVAIGLIQGNMTRQVTEALPADAPSFFFIDLQPDQMAPFDSLVASLPGSESLQQTPSLRGRLVAVNGVPAEQALRDPGESWLLRGDRGVTYSAVQRSADRVIEGNWWPADYAGPPLVSVYDSLAQAFGIGIGDRITVNVLGRDLEAEIANLRAIDWQTLSINFTMIFTPQPLAAAPHTFLATVKTTPEQEPVLEQAVARQFANVSMVSVRDTLALVNEVLGRVGVAVQATAAVTLLAGTLVLAGAVAAGHRRRVYDAVVLKVLGATRGRLLSTFLIEYGLLGLLTAVIAAAIGTLASWAVLTWVMRTDWAFMPGTVLATAGLCTALTLALGFVGTWRALGQKAAPLLRNE